MTNKSIHLQFTNTKSIRTHLDTDTTHCQSINYATIYSKQGQIVNFSHYATTIKSKIYTIKPTHFPALTKTILKNRIIIENSYLCNTETDDTY